MKICEVVTPAPAVTTKQSSAKLRANTVYSHCKPFLMAIDAKNKINEFNTWLMWRGSWNWPPTAFTKHKVRQRREPSDSAPFYHYLADDYFKDRFGIRYRSAALFASGDADEAATYGKIRVVFPIGEFKFCWSPKYTDLHNQLETDRSTSLWGYLVKLGRLRPESMPHHAIAVLEEHPELFTQYMDAGEYNNTDLYAGIRSGSEIMIACREYYAYDIEQDNDWDEFCEELLRLLS